MKLSATRVVKALILSLCGILLIILVSAGLSDAVMTKKTLVALRGFSGVMFFAFILGALIWAVARRNAKLRLAGKYLSIIGITVAMGGTVVVYSLLPGEWESTDAYFAAQDRGIQKKAEYAKLFGGPDMFKVAKDEGHVDDPDAWSRYVEKYGSKEEYLRARRAGIESPSEWKDFKEHPVEDPKVYANMSTLERDLEKVPKLDKNASKPKREMLESVRNNLLPHTVPYKDGEEKTDLTLKEVAFKENRFIKYYVSQNERSSIESFKWADPLKASCFIIKNNVFVDSVNARVYTVDGERVDEVGFVHTESDCY